MTDAAHTSYYVYLYTYDFLVRLHARIVAYYLRSVYSPSHFPLCPTLPFPQSPTSRHVLRSQCTSVWEVLQASVVSRHLHRANSQCGSPTVRTCIMSTNTDSDITHTTRGALHLLVTVLLPRRMLTTLGHQC